MWLCFILISKLLLLLESMSVHAASAVLQSSSSTSFNTTDGPSATPLAYLPLSLLLPSSLSCLLFPAVIYYWLHRHWSVCCCWCMHTCKLIFGLRMYVLAEPFDCLDGCTHTHTHTHSHLKMLRNALTAAGCFACDVRQVLLPQLISRRYD